MTNEWYNNEISKRLYKHYNHDFSICDIDGVCRKFYRDGNEWKTRLVIYESKYEKEYFSQTQMNTLYVLDKNINWNNFDKHSGVYAIIHNKDLSELSINKILNISKTIKFKGELNHIKFMSLDSFYNWISVKDIEQDYGFNKNE